MHGWMDGWMDGWVWMQTWMDEKKFDLYQGGAAVMEWKVKMRPCVDRPCTAYICFDVYGDDVFPAGLASGRAEPGIETVLPLLNLMAKKARGL